MMMALLGISCWMRWWKYFENRWTTEQWTSSTVIHYSMVAQLFGLTLYTD